MAKSLAWYLENEDFEGAVKRWESTSPCWKARWFEVCSKIYNTTKKWFDKYILDPIGKTIQKVKEVYRTGIDCSRPVAIQISADCPAFDDGNGKEKCYLIEFFDEDGRFICSKVGTTVRAVKQRIKEELKSPTYANMGADTCVIRRVYNCNGFPAEGAESYFRAMYIKKHPECFKKNDRFIQMRFDYAEADKAFAEYCAQIFSECLCMEMHKYAYSPLHIYAFGRPLVAQAADIPIISHLSKKVNRQIIQKIKKFLSQNCAKLPAAICTKNAFFHFLFLFNIHC